MYQLSNLNQFFLDIRSKVIPITAIDENLLIANKYIEIITNKLEMESTFPKLMFISYPRSYFSQLLLLVYSVYSAIKGGTKKDTILVCRNKQQVSYAGGRLIDILIAVKSLIGIDYIINQNQYYVEFIVNNSRIILMRYQYNKDIIMTNILKSSINCDLLIPLEAPYSTGYDAIRKILLNNIYNNNGTELIMSYGGDINIDICRYFYNLMNSFMLHDDSNVEHYMNFPLKNMIMDSNKYEVVKNLRVRILNNNETAYKREYECEFI